LPSFIAKAASTQPGRREHWKARVLRIGELSPEIRMVGFVTEPLKQLDRNASKALCLMERHRGLQSKNRKVLGLVGSSQATLIRDPSLIEPVTEAISSYTVSGTRAERLRLDLGYTIGLESCLGTSSIDLDTPDTFAYLEGVRDPIRVVKVMDPPATSVIRAGVILSRTPKKGSKWLISWLQTGDTETFMEPTQARDLEMRRRALAFWSTHAHIHRPEFMSEPFVSTWREVLQHANEEEAKTDDAGLDQDDEED